MRLSTTNHIRDQSLQLALLQANQCPSEQHAPNLDSCGVFACHHSGVLPRGDRENSTLPLGFFEEPALFSATSQN